VTAKGQTEIGDPAPVKGAGEIEIGATPKAVWDVLTAIARWPSWNPDVKAVSVPEVVAEGSQFRWKAGPGTITSTIRRLDEPRLIEWTGTTFGIKAVHVHTLEARDGRTLVRTAESYHGLVARLFRRPLKKTLDEALASGLKHLRIEAERRAQL
jgi:hypothetical protein